VSQPGQRSAQCCAPGPLDAKLGEFWAKNPWDIVKEGHNLSAFERKRTWINRGGKDFIDVSYLSGTDNDGDGRSVIGCDFRNNGKMDLIVRNVGGGALWIYENDFPTRHYLEVSLRGKKSNRLGIGARVTAELGSTTEGHARQVVREVFSPNSYASQGPSRVHLGLADNPRVDRLTIQWPSGRTQVLENVAADRHIVIDEDKDGEAAIEVVVPGRTIRP
jgi:hypothetical protein